MDARAKTVREILFAGQQYLIPFFQRYYSWKQREWDPFRPKLVKGKGIAGICLIRLKQIRPRFVPSFLGISSGNAAHRIAVEWDEHGETKPGV